MPYRENVAALAAELGLENPLAEKDLAIAMAAFSDQTGNPKFIHATGMNRAGRLFLQNLLTQGGGERKMLYTWTTEHSRQAAEFFAENWLDAEEKGRKMLIAMRSAERVTIEWKS